jgi:hypothetical protein
MHYLPPPTAALLVLVDCPSGCCLALCRLALAHVPVVTGPVGRLAAACVPGVRTLAGCTALVGIAPVPGTLGVLLVAQILVV